MSSRRDWLKLKIKYIVGAIYVLKEDHVLIIDNAHLSGDMGGECDGKNGLFRFVA